MDRSRANAARRRRGQLLGVTLIAAGIAASLVATYGAWGTTPSTEAHQQNLNADLVQGWQQPAEVPVAPLTAGEPMARLSIPRLGQQWTVVEGVAEEDIVDAPGHYPETARPGQVGNFSVAGHRTRAIFWDLDRLEPGDPIIVETEARTFTYEVTSTEIVVPTAVEVVAPVPGHPDQRPTVAVLTLTTCNPKWDNYQRLVVHATLASTSDTAPNDMA